MARARTTVCHRFRVRDREVRHVHRVGGAVPETPVQRRARLIREFLDVLDITQVNVARVAGVSPEHLNRVLHGRYPMTGRIADALTALTLARRELFFVREEAG